MLLLIFALQQLSPMLEKGLWLEWSENLEQLMQQPKTAITTSLALCWKRTEKLNDLAKFVAYFYQSKYGADSSRESYLLKAQTQADEIVTVDVPRFSANLLTL